MKLRERESKEKRGGARRIGKDVSAFSKTRHRSRPTPSNLLVQRSLKRHGYGDFQDSHHNSHHGHRQFQNSARNLQQVREYPSFSRSSPVDRLGHRGFAHLPRRWVPREPPSRGENQVVTTVFVDGLHMGMAKEWLFDKFSEVGRVRDVYVSSKVRKYSRDAFGFVRYGKKAEALLAIKKFHGVEVKGKKLSVTLAKYNKQGRLYQVDRGTRDTNTTKQKFIKYPSFRDERRYIDVVKGKQSKTDSGLKETIDDRNKEQPPNEGNIGEKAPALTEKRGVAWPMLRFSLKAVQNVTLAERMKLALIGELQQEQSMEKAANLIADSELNVEWVSSLSQNILIIFFGSEEDREAALSKSSMVWTVLEKVRKWSDEQCFIERMVWIECSGLHPKCCSSENYKAIGEKWGEVIRINHDRNGLYCLTYARILIRTKQQQRIEARINTEWESGFCEVWVREVDCWSVNTNERRNSSVEEEDMEDYEQEKRKISYSPTSPQARKGCSNMERYPAAVHDGRKDVVNAVTTHELNVWMIKRGDNMCDMCGIEQEKKEATQREQSIENTQIVEHSKMQTETVNEHEEMENSGQEVALTTTQNWADLSIDDMIIGHYSCPEPRIECVFDPMSSIECSLSLDGFGSQKEMCLSAVKSTTNKRPRGRPKRVGSSLPVPLSVRSTPSEHSIEAVDTWNTGKRIGLATRNENTIISEIRKSKRIQIMEEGRQEQLEE